MVDTRFGRALDRAHPLVTALSRPEPLALGVGGPFVVLEPR